MRGEMRAQAGAPAARGGLQTEFELELPRGFVDDEGTLHRAVTMRRARAIDEIAPMRDPRVQKSPQYHAVILLSRVVTRIGTIDAISTAMIENLFVDDFSFLQQRYNAINYAEVAQPGEA